MNLGVSVEVCMPLTRGNATMYTVTKRLTGYSQTLSAWLGFDSATVQFPIKIHQIDDWLEQGVSRRILVRNRAHRPCFEGFVNSVEIQMGRFTMVTSELITLATRCGVIFTQMDYSVAPPVNLGATLTTLADNPVGVTKYGAIEKILQFGECELVTAQQARDNYLAENSVIDVIRQPSFDLGGEGGVMMTLNILGYGHYMNLYTYADAAATGTTTVSTKIGNVITAEPNGFFSTDLTRIQANPVLIHNYENGSFIASTIAKEILSLGDATYQKWSLGMYNNRVWYFSGMPTKYDYRIKVSSHRPVVLYANNALCDPYDIRPGKLAEIEDVSVGRIGGNGIRSDTRTMYIETVSWETPNNLSINGIKLSQLSQYLAQNGLGAIAG